MDKFHSASRPMNKTSCYHGDHSMTAPPTAPGRWISWSMTNNWWGLGSKTWTNLASSCLKPRSLCPPSRHFPRKSNVLFMKKIPTADIAIQTLKLLQVSSNPEADAMPSKTHAKSESRKQIIEICPTKVVVIYERNVELIKESDLNRSQQKVHAHFQSRS